MPSLLGCDSLLDRILPLIAEDAVFLGPPLSILRKDLAELVL